MSLVNSISGSITGVQSIELDAIGMSTATINVTGSWTGGILLNMQMEGSSIWTPVPAFNLTLGDGQLVTPIDTTGCIYSASIAGAVKIQLIGNTVTGTANLEIQVIETVNSILGIQGYVYTKQPGGDSWTVDGPLTDAQLRATPVPISGSISATNPSVSTTGTAIPASATMIGGSDGTNLKAVKVSSSGVVSVDGSASTQPVSGTIAATQSGAWNITNISGTVSLPTGAATSAKQPALGTAGSASTDVITVQGIASMTAIKTDSSATTQPVSFADTTASGTLAGSGQTVAIATNGKAQVVMVTSGTFSGVWTFEGTIDGSTWDAGVAGYLNSAGTLTGTTGGGGSSGEYLISVAGYTQLRVRCTSYTSGTLNIAFNASTLLKIPSVAQAGTWNVNAGGLVASGNTASGNPLKLGNVFNTTQPTVTNGQIVDTQATNRGATIVATGVDTFTASAVQSGTWNIATVTDITNQGQIVDNAAFTDGTTRLNMSGYIFDETAGTGLTENDAAAARIDSKRSVVMVVEDATTRGQRQAVSAAGAASTNLAQLAGNTLSSGNGVSGTGTLRVSVASDSTGQINALGTLADNGVAAATNRLPILPGVAATTYAALTSGRNTSARQGTDGLTWVAALPPLKPTTFSAASIGIVPAASATDIFVISGNATTTVLVTRLIISGTQTTGGTADIVILKRSTADTSGTSASVTAVPNDSSNSAASTAVLSYTANPTTGTLVGNLRTYKLALGTTTATTNNILDIRFADSGEGQPIVLRGTTQQLAVNLNGVTISGGSFNITVEWIEV